MGRGHLIYRQRTTVHMLATSLFAGAVLFTASLPAHAQTAGTWNKRGAQAEARDDYDAAYQDYLEAQRRKPRDLRYKADLERMRFQAAVAHVNRGRVLRQSGDPNGALAEFSRALAIDPGNQAAQQELGLLQQAAQPAPPPPAPEADEALAGQRQTLSDLSSVSGPVRLRPVSNEPITLHMVEDVKVIYQAIGKAAGLNVLFDPDFQSKRIPIDLTSVSLSDALRIVGTVGGAFYKPVTQNTIFVANNNRTKHTDLDELAVQTFYLTNATQQNDANEVTTAIRNLLDPSVKVYPVLSQNAIVMRATPDQLLLAQKLLNDLDRTRPEVVVDVAVLEVSRDKIRNLGITLPQSVTITPQASPTATSSTSSSSTTTSTTSAFTLNTLAHTNANNYAVSISGATLNALLSDADTRILQNPRIRATDGQRAQLKIGSKIPIATGSYNAGVSTGIASIGVQTQFTYQDVGVNIDMTPTVHYDREITLKMKIEVSSQTGSVTISGVTEPIIGQNVTDQVIQLKEGEPSILAGLVQTTDSKNVSGTPFLGEIPFLKYFFSSQNKETQRNEIVFLMIPHIVRESVLSRLNTRAIDTGTGQGIELRHDASLDSGDQPDPRLMPRATTPTSAANAASAMLQQLNQQAQAPTPATAAAQPGAVVSMSVVPSTTTPPLGSTFTVAVNLANGQDLFAVPLQMQFNAAVLQLVNVDTGDLLGRDGQAVSIVHRDEGNGLVTISTSRPPNSGGISGQGSIAVLTFKAVTAGDSSLSLVKVGARNSAQTNLPAVGSMATVHVQ
ncbi:MAG: tetratricopeptide repeat protein [Acidobacteriota bacterium]|nr:tetratricopeptide repeat protein [Acidobacteriota bacterium]